MKIQIQKHRKTYDKTGYELRLNPKKQLLISEINRNIERDERKMKENFEY